MSNSINIFILDSGMTVILKEPPQRGERRLTVQGSGEMANLTVAFRVLGVTVPDFTALALHNAPFVGSSSLGTFAGRGANRSSSLY